MKENHIRKVQKSEERKVKNIEKMEYGPMWSKVFARDKPQDLVLLKQN